MNAIADSYAVAANPNRNNQHRVAAAHTALISEAAQPFVWTLDASISAQNLLVPEVMVTADMVPSRYMFWIEEAPFAFQVGTDVFTSRYTVFMQNPSNLIGSVEIRHDDFVFHDYIDLVWGKQDDLATENIGKRLMFLHEVMGNEVIPEIDDFTRRNMYVIQRV